VNSIKIYFNLEFNYIVYQFINYLFMSWDNLLILKLFIITFIINIQSAINNYFDYFHFMINYDFISLKKTYLYFNCYY
jgi:hypothetical protein